MLNIAMARNWLLPTLAVMRLHAYLTQAITPGQAELRAAQLPGIAPSDASSLPKSESSDFAAAISSISKSEPAALPEAQKALERIGQAEIVDATFKVIGERYVTPSSFVHLVVKARLTPLAKDGSAIPLPKPETNEKRDNEFVLGKKDVEDLPQGDYTSGYAHAPYWPAVSAATLPFLSIPLTRAQ